MRPGFGLEIVPALGQRYYSLIFLKSGHPIQVIKVCIGGNSFELILDMESADASQFGVKVCVSPDGQEETVIYYDATEGKLKVDTRKSGPEDTPKTIEAAPFELKDGERLKLRIFVDKSVVEVFANSRQAVMRRIYPSRSDSVGVRLFSTGGDTKVHTLEAYNITPSNPY